MGQAVDTGKDKVKKICEVLRRETLEPALSEAKLILDDAHEKGKEIVEEAKKRAKALLDEAQKEIEKKESIFQVSIKQGARQATEWLRQEIEERLLTHNLSEILKGGMSNPDVVARLVNAVVAAIEKEGVSADLSALIPTAVSPREVNELLGKHVLERLREKSVIVGPSKGGIEIKLHKEKITLDLTTEALLELMTRYVRKDFHQLFYAGAK